MAASSWIIYDNALQELGDADLAFDTGTFKVALFLNTFTGNVHATGTLYSGFSNEVSNGVGYTTGGDSVTVTWAETGAGSGIWRLDSDDPQWTASGGSITGIRYAVLYETATSIAVCYCELDTASDITVTDTNTLTIQLSANGYFEIDNSAAADT
jgi:hypothetical protein